MLIVYTLLSHVSIEVQQRQGSLFCSMLGPQYLGHFQARKHPVANKVKFTMSGIQSNITQPTLGGVKGWHQSHPPTPRSSGFPRSC